MEMEESRRKEKKRREAGWRIVEDSVTNGEMWEEDSVEGRKKGRREESEEDMKEERRSVKESGKEDREGQGGQMLRGGARKRWLGRTERGEAGEKLRRNPKVGMEAERRG